LPSRQDGNEPFDDAEAAVDGTLTRDDDIVGRTADRVHELAEKPANGNGLRARLARPLARQAALPAGQEPEAGAVAPSGPQLGRRPKTRGQGPNPFAVAAAAFAVGILVAKLVDWRGHAHRRG
jgi:hypothetical protein